MNTVKHLYSLVNKQRPYKMLIIFMKAHNLIENNKRLKTTTYMFSVHIVIHDMHRFRL